FHLLARQEIKSVADLANQKVNVDLRGAGTTITAARLFELLNIPATATYDDQEVALDKLHRGEIAAMAFVAGKPAPIFRNLNANDGFKAPNDAKRQGFARVNEMKIIASVTFC